MSAASGCSCGGRCSAFCRTRRHARRRTEGRVVRGVLVLRDGLWVESQAVRHNAGAGETSDTTMGHEN